MKPLFLLFNFLCSADAASTNIALHQSHIGKNYQLIEGDFLLHTQNPYLIDAEVAAECYYVDRTFKRLWVPSTLGLTNEEAFNRMKHDKREARIVLITGIFIRGFVVYSNIRQLRK